MLEAEVLLSLSEVRMPRRTLAILVFFVAAVFAGHVLAGEPKWPPGPFKYLVIDQDVKGVLVEFGRNVRVPVDVSDQVKGRLRGQIEVAPVTAREFLNRLCENYGLVWYFDGAVLHVSAQAETRTEFVSIGRLSPGEASEKLSALGVADARFPMRTTQDSGVMSISGPPPFVSLVRQSLAALTRRSPPVREDDHGDEIRIRVFRGGSATVPSETPVTSGTKSRS